MKTTTVKDKGGRMIYKFRVWLANSLIWLAFRIRPKDLNQWMKSLEDSIKYGNGLTIVNPQDVYKNI